MLGHILKGLVLEVNKPLPKGLYPGSTFLGCSTGICRCFFSSSGCRIFFSDRLFLLPAGYRVGEFLRVLRHTLLIDGLYIGGIGFGLQMFRLFIGLQLLAVDSMVNGMCTDLSCFCRGIGRLDCRIIVLVIGRNLSVNHSGHGCSRGMNRRSGEAVTPAGQFTDRDILLFKGEVRLSPGCLIRIQLQLSLLRSFSCRPVRFVRRPVGFGRSLFDPGICKLVLCEMEPGRFLCHITPPLLLPPRTALWS